MFGPSEEFGRNHPPSEDREWLAKIRVLDLTRVWSGPLAGRILADLGAEVIRISSRATVSGRNVSEAQARSTGLYPDHRPGDRPWDRISTENDFNRNKRSLTLELDTPEGADLFKRLVGISDVVLENFSPRVMPNFGLDYEALRAIRPQLIFCSLPAYGRSGPLRDHVSYGTNIEAFSGWASLTGYAGEGPSLSGNAYPDAAAALHAVSAVLTALVFRQRTGQGQWIDLSQAESAVCLIGAEILAYALSGVIPRPIGNRRPDYAPQGCYRCRGEDQWVAIAVSDETEWQALARLLGRSEWLSERRFSDPRLRFENQDELDEVISHWTGQRTAEEAMSLLQRSGVPSGAVRNAAELLADPHLGERDFFLKITHPEWGSRKYCSLPIRFSDLARPQGRPASSLGEDNEYVLKGLLGLSADEILRLEDRNIIGRRPMD